MPAIPANPAERRWALGTCCRCHANGKFRPNLHPGPVREHGKSPHSQGRHVVPLCCGLWAVDSHRQRCCPEGGGELVYCVNSLYSVSCTDVRLLINYCVQDEGRIQTGRSTIPLAIGEILIGDGRSPLHQPRAIAATSASLPAGQGGRPLAGRGSAFPESWTPAQFDARERPRPTARLARKRSFELHSITTVQQVTLLLPWTHKSRGRCAPRNAPRKPVSENCPTLASGWRADVSPSSSLALWRLRALDSRLSPRGRPKKAFSPRRR